jgi:AcrR family transcriptional regulator
MAFYEQALEAMAPRMEALAGKASFEERIAAIMAVKFEYFQPNRAFLGALFRHAADPQNRLSPFSEATRHIREFDQMYFARAIATKSGEVRVPEDLAPFLPKILWLYRMGLILHWIYDRSPDQRRTPCVAREESGASGQQSKTVWFCAGEAAAAEVRGTHCSGGRRAERCLITD